MAKELKPCEGITAALGAYGAFNANCFCATG